MTIDEVIAVVEENGFRFIHLSEVPSSGSFFILVHYESHVYEVYVNFYKSFAVIQPLSPVMVFDQEEIDWFDKYFN